jgi:hypothetical protein
MVKNEDTKVEKQNLKSERKKQKLSNVETDRQTNIQSKLKGKVFYEPIRH